MRWFDGPQILISLFLLMTFIGTLHAENWLFSISSKLDGVATSVLDWKCINQYGDGDNRRTKCFLHWQQQYAYVYIWSKVLKQFPMTALFQLYLLWHFRQLNVLDSNRLVESAIFERFLLCSLFIFYWWHRNKSLDPRSQTCRFRNAYSNGNSVSCIGIATE